MIWELETGTLYKPDQTATIKEVAENEVEDGLSGGNISPPVDRIKIFFLPCNPAETLEKKVKKYENSFDSIYLSTGLAHRLGDCVALLQEETGRIHVESANMMLDLTKEMVEGYEEKVCEMAKQVKNGCLKRVEAVGAGGPRPDHITFLRQKQNV